MATADRHARTEKPTPKRRREARRDGRVARAPDVSAWALVLAGSYALPWYLNNATARLVGVMGEARAVIAAPSVAGALGVLGGGLRVVLVTALPLGGLAAVLALVLNAAQTGASLSFAVARPRWSRISPKAGVRRLFSGTTLEQLGKQLIKLIAVTGIAALLMSRLAHALVGTAPVSLLPVLGATGATLLSLTRLLAAVGLGVGLVDYGFVRRRLMVNLRMTKEEVREESRAAEGDPHVKAALRRRMYRISRSKMRAGLRRADVLVTNPTHYAVALQYDAARAGAPRVLAKGADRLARRLREDAALHNVPIVEDPPLARYLYALCEVDQQIPPEIYLAVAKILAFVFALPGPARTARVHQLAPSALPAPEAVIDQLSGAARLRAARVLTGSPAQ